ncbi:metal ABC transporter substrate-binding protein [Pseudalkalibacillus berkeleyi]|uniref:Metal ABC transporter substrate-binding protein n=1 Tax=Pseudalkalibacillus berkeleyi TaxID=1069813 RepID=A0ABS9H6H1_9BACL|nr:metal ABC transporter substrate-binding protein [Pseudalkalibacillus berkeleyi]MCF6139270.1 metal ABC transporter substrate-binding protein [Pseudalkalibacillus berkeleyi]
MLKKAYLLFVGVLMALLLAACSGDSEAEGGKKDGEKLKVVTTYSILYDMVKNVGGDKVEVHSMVKIGANPHEYDPLPEDVKKTADADAVFYNGLNLEAGNSWFEKLLGTTGKDGEDAPVFRLSEGVDPKYLTTKGKEGEEDPHAWLDIANGIKYVENIRDGLIEADPDNKETYEKNAEEYISKLEKLHEEAKTSFSKIPKEDRFLITSEGAFKYFSAAYDIQSGYIWEINAENQGTPDQVRQVVDLIREKDVKVLFLETSIDARSMETVSRETGIPIGGKVFTDSIGAPGEDGDSYIKMMEWNINTIREQLEKHSK